MDIVLKGLGGRAGLDNEYTQLLLMSVQIAKGEISVNFDNDDLKRLEELNQAIKIFIADSMTAEDLELLRKCEEQA